MRPEQVDVLVVEDEVVVQKAARRILEAEGLTVAQALDAQTAGERIRTQHYKLILSDLKLPGSSGFEILELAKAVCPRTPIILITGYATLENAIRSFQLGAFDFIPKPFDVAELLGVVRRALRCFAAAAPTGGADDPFQRLAAPRRGEVERDPRYFLGAHAWATLQSDGTATFGVAETFPGLLGPVKAIEFPRLQDHTTQGKCVVQIVSDPELIHRVWAPLSGTVIATNTLLSEEPDLLNTDPFSRGWLVRIIPANLEGELNALTRR